jgi:hypothetical protein
MGIYWPCHFQKTPTFEKAVLDTMGKEVCILYSEIVLEISFVALQQPISRSQPTVFFL